MNADNDNAIEELRVRLARAGVSAPDELLAHMVTGAQAPQGIADRLAALDLGESEPVTVFRLIPSIARGGA